MAAIYPLSAWGGVAKMDKRMKPLIILTLLLTACTTNAELAETWATDAVATREAEAHSVLATACGDSGVRPTHSAPTITAIVGTATAEARSPYLATGCGHIPTPEMPTCEETNSRMYSEYGDEMSAPQCSGFYSVGMGDVVGIFAYYDCREFTTSGWGSRGIDYWHFVDDENMTFQAAASRIATVRPDFPSDYYTNEVVNPLVEYMQEVGTEINPGQRCSNYQQIFHERAPSKQNNTVDTHIFGANWYGTLYRTPEYDLHIGDWHTPCWNEDKTEVVTCGGDVWSVQFPSCFSWSKDTNYTIIWKSMSGEVRQETRVPNERELEWMNSGCHTDGALWILDRLYSQ